MATVAFKGSQSLLKLGNGASPEVFTTIGEVRSIGPFGAKNDLIEVTHLLSTQKEFIGGLPEGLEIEVVCNYIPTNTQQLRLVTLVNAGTAGNFQYVLPSGGGSLKWDFSALVLGWTVGAVTPNEAVEMNITLKITGAITGNPS